MSTAPPAANGITMVTGRSGQLCAQAGTLAAARTARPANIRIVSDDLLGDFMGTSAGLDNRVQGSPDQAPVASGVGGRNPVCAMIAV
jgi:hypothetical protein